MAADQEHRHRRGGDRREIGQEQQERAAREIEIAMRDQDAARGQGRAQRGRDRDADHRAADALGHGRVSAGRAANQRDHHIEQIGRGARQ